MAESTYDPAAFRARKEAERLNDRPKPGFFSVLDHTKARIVKRRVSVRLTGTEKSANV